MASEIRVNKLNSSTGVGTITLSPTGVDISGVTTASTLRATTGIITTLQVGTISGDGSSLTGIAATNNVRTGILDVAGVGTFRGDVNIPDKIIHLGDTNTAIRFPSADTITAETGGSERLRIDSSGRMGLGITPTDYHSNNTSVFQLKDGNTIFSRTGGTFLGMFQNIKYNSSDVSQYVTSNPGSAYFQTSGEHKWYTAASGTADNNATLTERLHITSAGGLEQSGGVSSHYVLTNSGKAPNHIHIDGPAGNSGEMGGAISFDCGGTGCAAIAGLQQSSDADKIGLAFVVHQSATASDDAIEAARFDNDGKFLVGRTGSITIASDPSDHNFEQLTNNGMALALHCDQNDQRGFGIYYTGSKNPSDFIRCQVTTSPKFLVTGSGNTQNANNSYGSISDISLKENIVDANSQWDDIKNIKVRNYNFKESVGHGTHTQIGVVAQELETVSPKLVETSDKDGMKNVQYSVLYMKSVKALQEAMTRIETLEAKVAALEGS